MKFIRIDKNNQVNGNGLRTVIWVSGCENHCQGCHNPETWDYNSGHEWNDEDEQTLRQQMSMSEINGITLTGGDPMAPLNREDAAAFCKHFKEQYPNKTIWIYTGHLFEEVKDYCKFADVVIDGKYDAAKNRGIGKHKWRGSSNQRVIDIKETDINGKISLYVDPFIGIIDENK